MSDGSQLLREFRNVFGPPLVASGESLSSPPPASKRARLVQVSTEQARDEQMISDSLEAVFNYDGATRADIETVFGFIQCAADLKQPKAFSDACKCMLASLTLLTKSQVEQIVSDERLAVVQDKLLPDPPPKKEKEEAAAAAEDEAEEADEADEEENTNKKEKKKSRKRAADPATIKRTVVGLVPFVWSSVVYELKIQETYTVSHGWQWTIKSCVVHPPWHDGALLRKFIKKSLSMAPAIQAMPDDSAYKLGCKQIDKEYKRALRDARKTRGLMDDEQLDPLQTAACAKEWLDSSPFGVIVASRCGDPTESLAWKAYPFLSDAYDQYRLCKKNPWWSGRVSDTFKSGWEGQLRRPATAYAMCFRHKMPAGMAFEGTFFEREYGQVRDRISILRFKLDNLRDKAENRRAPTHAHDVATLELSVEQALLDKALLPIRLAVDQQQQQKQQQPVEERKYTCLPEITLDGFQSLCVTQRWSIDFKTDVTCKRINKRQDKVVHSHNLVRPREVVPELQNMLLSIEAYKWFTNTIQADQDCCIVRSSVPEKFAAGIVFLVKQGVLVQESELVGTGDKPVLFLAEWHAAKVATARVLACMERAHRVAPQRPLDLEVARLGEGIVLSDDQKQFVDLVRAHPIVCLEGEFGTGKSQCIALLDKLRIPATTNMQVLAFTGNAVENIAQRITCARSTMHAFKQQQRQERIVRFDLTCVDETSMVTELLFMETLACLQTRRLVLVGDPGQIPAFGPYHGNLLRELLRVYPSHKLVHNYRQERDPANLIVANAQRVRALDTKLVLTSPSFYVRPKYDTCREAIMARAAATRFHEFQWVTALNEHSRELNLECVLRLREMDKTEWLAAAAAGPAAAVGQQLPADEVRLHTVPWSSQKPDVVLNTFWPGDRIIFTDKIVRSNYDAVDERLNQLHYARTSQLNAPVHILCRNGTHDEIEWIRTIHSEKDEQHAALEQLPQMPFATRAQYRIATPASQPFQATPLPRQQQQQQQQPRPPPPEWVQQRDEHANMLAQQHTQDSLIVLKLKSGRYVRLSDVFEHGYAETADKTQGREVDEVVLSLKGMPEAVSATNEARLSAGERYLRNSFGNEHFYTCIGRARKVFGMLGVGPREIAHMIQRPARQCASFLSQFIVRERTTPA